MYRRGPGVLGQVRDETAKPDLLAICGQDTAATHDDLREAVETLEAIAPLWKRVLGESHPETPAILRALKEARKALAARAASSSSAA